MAFESIEALNFLYKEIENFDFISLNGKVQKIIGLTIESAGPEVFLGEMCTIKTPGGRKVVCEVVGFKDNSVILMPLEEFSGISLGSEVFGS